jgi:hypothetical protein
LPTTPKKSVGQTSRKQIERACAATLHGKQWTHGCNGSHARSFTSILECASDEFPIGYDGKIERSGFTVLAANVQTLEASAAKPIDTILFGEHGRKLILECQL